MLVYLARHGETTWNVEGRYQGRRESELSALGRRQAEALAGAMAEAQIGAVRSSPLRRCTETARPAAERCGLAVETDERLIEIAHGTWEGRLRDEIAANDPERYRAWRSDPPNVAFEQGETLAAVRERWRAFVAGFAPPAPALVVTHDAVVRIALLEAQEAGLERFWETTVENGAYAIFDLTAARRWRLVEACVTAHLAGVRAEIAGQAL